jgi:diacylglycerol kinase (ATP)
VCDVVSPGYNEAVKRAKDIAAGGVLLAAIGAFTIGVLTFLPYFS